jgi:hypothetical protein
MRIQQYDTYPIDYQCVDENNQPIDLSSATSVGFVLTKDGDSTPSISAEATVVSPQIGLIRYPFQDGETDVPGMYRIEWKLDFSGSILTVPRNDILWLYIIGATHQ